MTILSYKLSRATPGKKLQIQPQLQVPVKTEAGKHIDPENVLIINNKSFLLKGRSALDYLGVPFIQVS